MQICMEQIAQISELVFLSFSRIQLLKGDFTRWGVTDFSLFN